MNSLSARNLRLLEPDIIELEAEDTISLFQTLDWATGESHRWARYLQGLALAGFTQWLFERQLETPLSQSQCTLSQRQYANWLDAVCNLTIGDFKLCLLVTESITQSTVSIPRAAVDLPEFAGHLYVLVEVEEETQKVIIRGLLRHDAWTTYRQTAHLTPLADWTYEVPLSIFEPEPRRLGLYIRHLDPATIPLPEAVSSQVATAPEQDQLQALELAQALDLSQPLWQQIAWEQARTVLTSPALLSEANPQQPLATSDPLQAISNAARGASQMVVNVAQWLDAGLDEVAESLGFFSYERLRLAHGIRSALTIEDAIENLRRSGLPIPANLNPVYRDIELNSTDFRLCLLPYAVSSETAESEDSSWSLIAILGTQTGDYLPEGLTLQIKKGTEILESYTLDFEEKLVYTLGDADFAESLRVSIMLPDGNHYDLPLLTFIYEEA